MARLLNQKVIKERIKANMRIMKAAKAKVLDDMSVASRPQMCDHAATRRALSSLLKASDNVISDKAKLESIGEN